MLIDIDDARQEKINSTFNFMDIGGCVINGGTHPGSIPQFATTTQKAKCFRFDCGPTYGSSYTYTYINYNPEDPTDIDPNKNYLSYDGGATWQEVVPAYIVITDNEITATGPLSSAHEQYWQCIYTYE